MCVLLAKSMRVNLVKPIAANNLVVDVDSSIHCRCFTGSWSINDMTLGTTMATIVLVMMLKECDGPEKYRTQRRRLNCDIVIGVLLPKYVVVQFVRPIANIHDLESSTLAVLRHSFYTVGVSEVELREVCI